MCPCILTVCLCQLSIWMLSCSPSLFLPLVFLVLITCHVSIVSMCALCCVTPLLPSAMVFSNCLVFCIPGSSELFILHFWNVTCNKAVFEFRFCLSRPAYWVQNLSAIYTTHGADMCSTYPEHILRLSCLLNFETHWIFWHLSLKNVQYIGHDTPTLLGKTMCISRLVVSDCGRWR